MTSWIAQSIGHERRAAAQADAVRLLLASALGGPSATVDYEQLHFVADGLALAVVDLLGKPDQVADMRALSAEAYQVLRVLPRPTDPLEQAHLCLRMACFAVLGDRGADVARHLREKPWQPLPIESPAWGERAHATILDVWLRLLRKHGWGDLSAVQERIVALREQQQAFEADYLAEQGSAGRTAAWRLVVLYHLAKAAELLAVFTTQGYADRSFDIRQQLEAQFDRALIACERAEIIDLYGITRLLMAAAQQLVDNCIWTVTRAVNSRVTQFVTNLVAPERQRPIFEMLPPQRRTLREAGLLGSSYRSVVVNLPTSSGKTVIAQFRILQALNQFDIDRGWVAYLVPTRALVNQICIRLRRDFAPLDISVERVSPALHVDGPEAQMLVDNSPINQFRVLVTTPEKLDLLLRGGWEARVGRPLTLVVVDEAHNLAQSERGIKLELLLATINRECRYAQFLLLTPFIPNAEEIAHWLAPDSYTNIDIGFDWQPNDRIIALSRVEQGNRRGDASVTLEPIHTTRQTLAIQDVLPLVQGRPLGFRWSDLNTDKSRIAAVTAQALRGRGPLIILVGKVDHTWSLARHFKVSENRAALPHEDIQLVQRYLRYEFGDSFELIDLLNYGVGVHHAGLSDEARVLMEWLLDRERLQVLVATTTIAQGVNFPVAGVVLAAHQYPYGNPMPPEDFWNLAGRVGRVDQGSVGVVALVAKDDASARQLREFVNRNVAALNSSLVAMVQQGMQLGNLLDLHRLYDQPQWSAFLQYLVHTYRQIDNPTQFSREVEHVLRGTLGFQTIRQQNPTLALSLVEGVRRYGTRMTGKPLQLVDTTGFSLESIVDALKRLRAERLTEQVWDAEALFSGEVHNLSRLVSILFDVPELSDDLEKVTSGSHRDSQRIAQIIRDWVQGMSLPELARSYFINNASEDEGSTDALTKCCRALFGRLTQTASWGLAALQSMTFGPAFQQLPESEQQTLRNLPARVLYGVNNDAAVTLRLLGVPRGAAQPLAAILGDAAINAPLGHVRNLLRHTDADVWARAMGNSGKDYYHVWRVVEGLDNERW